jgi:hypothetical protein
VAQLIQREQSMFAAQRDATSSQLNALNQLKTLLNGEVGSLQQKMQNMDQELTLMKRELNNTTNLVEKGLAIAPREYTLRETELDTEGRRLDLDTAALRAKEDIGKADQSIVELRNKTRDQVQTELSDTEQKLSETAARIATGTSIIDRESTTTSGSPSTSEDPAVTCMIIRRDGGKTKQFEGDETTAIEPGDTIKVLRAPVETSVSDAAPPAAVDPPEPAAVDPPKQAVAPPRPSPKPAPPPRQVPRETDSRR